MEALLAAADVVPAPHRGAQARALVAGRRLQIGRLERRVAEDAGVCHAVQRAAAGHAEVVIRRDLVQAVHAVHRHLLEPHLAAPRQVLLPLRERLGALPRLPAQQLAELGRVEREHVHEVFGGLEVAAPAVRHREIPAAEVEPAVLVDDEQLLHLLVVLVLAVRREAHYLVFLAEAVEADELADGRVEEADRDGQRHAVEDLDLRAGARRRHQAREVAGAVVRERAGALERRAVVGAGQMGEVVLDVHELRLRTLRQQLRELLAVAPAAGEVLADGAPCVDRMGEDVADLRAAVGGRVARHGDMRDVGERDAGGLQHPVDRANGERRVVLHAFAQTLLAHRRLQLAVHDDARGRIRMECRNAQDHTLRRRFLTHGSLSFERHIIRNRRTARNQSKPY